MSFLVRANDIKTASERDWKENSICNVNVDKIRAIE